MSGVWGREINFCMLRLLLALSLSCLVLKGCMMLSINGPLRVQLFLSQFLPLYFENRFMWLGLNLIVMQQLMPNKVWLIMGL